MRVIQLVPDLNLAGAQTMCETLSIELKKMNDIDLKIVSLYSDHSPITERLEKERIEIIYLDKKKGLDLSQIIKLKRLLEQLRPDVIHTHRYVLQYLIPAAKLSRYKNFKIIHTIHNLADKDVQPKLFSLQKRWFAKKLAQPVAISETIKGSIVQGYGLNPQEVPIVYNGVLLRRCVKKTDYSSTNRIVHIGRFQEAKNQPEIIDIFQEVLKSHPEQKLTFIGTGEQMAFSREKVKKLNLESSIKFAGQMPSVYKELNNSDIFILLSKFEGLPMTLIEAMATGLPCVAYPVGGIPEMIENGSSGFLPENKQEAIEAINKLIEDKSLRETVGKNAYEKSKIFSSSTMAQCYKSLYEKAILNRNKE